MRLTLVLLLLALVSAVALVAASVERSLTFGVRQIHNEDGRLSLVLYTGHPSRAVTLNIKWSLPGETAGDPAPAWLSGQARPARLTDLPGRYPALHLTRGDPLGQTAIRMSGGGGTAGLPLSPAEYPRLRIQSRGQYMWIPVNVSSTPDYSTAGSHHRGAFYIGPGSFLYTQWRYAALGKSVLSLSNDAPPPPSRGPRTRLPCSHFDASNRCVLTHVENALSLQDGRGDVTPLALFPSWKHATIHVVWDTESSYSVLPSGLYAALRHGSAPGSGPRWHALQWMGRALARPQDVGDGGNHAFTGTTTTMSNDAGTAALVSGPEFVVSPSENVTLEAFPNTYIIKLGRRTLNRLFGEMVYDSSEAAFYVIFSEEQPLAVKWVLAVLAGVQAFLVARFLVSPYNLSLTTNLALTLRARMPVDDLTYSSLTERNARRDHVRALWQTQNRNEVVDMLFCTLSTGIALAGLILGYLYTGTGAGMDTDLATLLQTYSVFGLALGCAQIGVWGVSLVLPFVLRAPRLPNWHEQRLEEMFNAEQWADRVLYQSLTHALYAHNAALGTVVGLLPVAGLTMLGFVMVALLVVILLLPMLTYNGVSAFLVVKMRWLRRRGGKSSSGYLQGAGVLGLLLLVLQVPHAYYAHVYLLQPMFSSWDVTYSKTLEYGLSFLFLLAISTGILLRVAGEVVRMSSAVLATVARARGGAGGAKKVL